MNRYVMTLILLLLLTACSSAETSGSGDGKIELEDLTIEISDYEMKSSTAPDEENVQVTFHEVLYYQFKLVNTGEEAIGSMSEPFLEVYIEAKDDLMELMEPNPFGMNHSNMWGGIGKTQMYLNPGEPGEYELAYMIPEIQETTKVMDQAHKAEVVIIQTDSNGDSEELKRIHLDTK